MIRIQKSSPIFKAVNFVTNPIMGKIPKDERRHHILYCYYKDGKLIYTNGKYLSLAEIETPDYFENETFYEVLKRNKSEIIIDKIDSDEPYPDFDGILSEYPDMDLVHPAGDGYTDSAVCFILQETGAIFNVQALINALNSIDFGTISGKVSKVDPICVEESHNGYKNQIWLMPKKA